MRSRIVSPGPVSPTRISASSRDSALGLRVMTARIRLGCSRPAWLAARTASYCSASSVTMISVSTVPEAGPPIRRRAWVSASWMAPVVVSVRSMVIPASPESRYSRRHVRPSRAIIASADAGPAEPAGYWSGLV